MRTASGNPRRRPQGECGSAVLVILVFLAIMVVLVAANTRTVNWARREVKLVNQQQVQRLTRVAAHPAPVPGASSKP